ncbi:MAG: hybrid sensor histidine kinase/response regulator [Ramlibacter sp.]|jgi:signal transduction histidine kinase/ActR/RegA family two-component response regulator|uniref:response regulator n=1 Tax=Ramlibacter sp. TaxID=1917967 RepID=UPI00261CF97E|nr:response regulator [Ramlibacter sp.]MDB5751770.1 hybrid sensor histidine kinase/response regulator [Ramlibacter sp.]
MELRVLVHAPRGRDAAVVQGVLAQQGITALVCTEHAALLAALVEGAAAVVVTEEALPDLMADDRLVEWLSVQPPWSDFPFVVLATKREGRRPDNDFRKLHNLGNLVLLERPLNAETLASAAESAVRARRRQYAAREHLDELGQTRQELQRLNGELESRILQRTRELASANDRLMKEINERERAQAALTQVQKMEAIGRLTGGIAHDFNNLLHVVNMNLELVSLYAKEEKVKPVVDRAKSAARRGARLTNQLLSFARSQSLLPQLTHVNQLLAGMKDLLEISVGSGVEVELDLCDEDAMVVLDPGQMEMAVLNLAVNSRDAMPAGGKLKIVTGTRYFDTDERDLPAGDYVIVAVTDEGAGIPSNVLPKVFDPFFTTKPVGSGTGLGLSQVYGFARQSGGIARVRSEEGVGTTVEILFPQADEEAPGPVATRQGPAIPRLAGACHILVVEDDPDVRRVIVECLSLIGYKVTEAANGTEALQSLAAVKPDVLVVDYAMPDMTGAEVISEARKLVGELPVIMATGYADMAAVERLAGKPKILRKPFDIAALGDAVTSVLEAARDKAEAASL